MIKRFFISILLAALLAGCYQYPNYTMYKTPPKKCKHAPR